MFLGSILGQMVIFFNNFFCFNAEFFFSNKIHVTFVDSEAWNKGLEMILALLLLWGLAFFLIKLKKYSNGNVANIVLFLFYFEG